ncbi:hypothetical protein Pint_25208 [Pistacia integerrima]|uniref:Uncharacterized protein n=1 Tax=Pistacia integerrima TaxID=434235 RepID=A0ACC0YHA2_9ROSI|nr:hypothetical protein Pint_25208 [Pistacia integerrima]
MKTPPPPPPPPPLPLSNVPPLNPTLSNPVPRNPTSTPPLSLASPRFLSLLPPQTPHPLSRPRTHPFLRRCVSDLGDPLPTQVAAETPQSPQSQNANMVCPGTPLSAAKFPPIPSTLRRSVSDPNPSPAPTFSSSCDRVGEYDVPNAEWARKFSNCMKEMARKWDELLGFEEDKSREENHNRSNSNKVENNNASMDNCGEDFVEAVTVEKAGECLIIHFKCPCGRGYQILLSGKICYYKLIYCITLAAGGGVWVVGDWGWALWMVLWFDVRWCLLFGFQFAGLGFGYADVLLCRLLLLFCCGVGERDGCGGPVFLGGVLTTGAAACLVLF